MVPGISSRYQSGGRIINQLNRILTRSPVLHAPIGLSVGVLVFFSVFLSSGAALQAQNTPNNNAGKKLDNFRPAPPGEAHEKIRLRKFRKHKENQGKILYRYAREVHAGGNFPRALRAFQEFIILYPEHIWAFDALQETAEILQKMERPGEAADYFIRAYRRAHNERRGGMAYLKAGRILAEMGRTRRARRIFQELQGWKRFSDISRLAQIELNSIRFLDGNPSTEDSGRLLKNQREQEDTKSGPDGKRVDNPNKKTESKTEKKDSTDSTDKTNLKDSGAPTSESDVRGDRRTNREKLSSP